LPELYILYKYEARALGKKFLGEMAPVFGVDMRTNIFGFRHTLIPWIRVSLNSYQSFIWPRTSTPLWNQNPPLSRIHIQFSYDRPEQVQCLF
jgi:hypothetical protein